MTPDRARQLWAWETVHHAHCAENVPVTPEPPPIYLGPAVPRWQPRTLDDVRTVLADGTLDERKWLEVKELVGAGDGAKKEFARDVASFAVDGGALLIGIAEDKRAGTFAVAPVLLAGMPETIDQVLRSRCDPALFVQCHPIADPADPTRGVMVVHVPPSALAPHMVDGRYYGRADKSKHVLSDAEVARLHSVRTARQLAASDVIKQEIARDPAPREHDLGVRLYMMAEPLASPPELLTEHLGTPSLDRLVRASHVGVGWSDLLAAEPRATGYGWRSLGMLPGRVADPATTSQVIDLEISDDATIALYANQLSGVVRPHDLPGQQFVFDEAVLVLVLSMILLARDLGTTYGYPGQWRFATGLVGIRGMPAVSAAQSLPFVHDAVRYSADHYVQGTQAVTVELAAQPRAVARRLLMRFVRALGVLDHHEQNFNDAPA